MLQTSEWDALSDEELLDLVRTGDPDAYGVLFSRYRYFATRLARRFTVLGEEEDVVNEAFASMLHQVRRGGGPLGNVHGYLATCVRHEAVRRARHHVRTRTTDQAALLDTPVPFGKGASDLAERETLKEALTSLTARQRALLWAIEVEGRKPREIAAELGTGPNAVSALAYRARTSLRAAYADLA